MKQLKTPFLLSESYMVSWQIQQGQNSIQLEGRITNSSVTKGEIYARWQGFIIYIVSKCWKLSFFKCRDDFKEYMKSVKILPLWISVCFSFEPKLSHTRTRVKTWQSSIKVDTKNNHESVTTPIFALLLILKMFTFLSFYLAFNVFWARRVNLPWTWAS